MARLFDRFPFRIFAILSLLFIAGLACRGNAPAVANHPADNVATLAHGGYDRTYRLHIPASYDGVQPLPLVLALHGGGGTGENMVRLTGDLNDLADAEGFLVAYPDGVEKHWNDGRALTNRRTYTENIDDVGFLKALVDRIAQEYAVDPGRIYAMGISNGGMMSYRLACEATDTFSAIAAVVSSMSVELFASCAPTRPVSVLVMNGTADPLVPWQGGTIRVGRQEFGQAVSALETVTFWVRANRCSAPPVSTELPDSDPDAGTRVRLEAYQDCASGSAVEFYTVEEGGHTWPGGLQYLPEWMVGKTSRDIDANQVIWQFFNEHTGPE
jgi:polyhydroxybutyrate depolymerase